MEKRLVRVPHALVIMFGITLLVTILSYFVPAGSFQRIVSEATGRLVVVPGTFEFLTPTPIGFENYITAFLRGFKKAGDVIFVVLSGGVMFAILDRTKSIEKTVGVFVRTLGMSRKKAIVIIMTLLYGVLGVAVGYENNIALVPIAAMVSLAIGGDLILAAGMSVGAMTIGFGLSPINPYTVGLGHKLAQLPLFSGSGLRSILCFLGIVLMCYYNLRYLKKIVENKTNGLGDGLNTEGLSLKQSLSSYKMEWKDWVIFSVFIVGLTYTIYAIFNYGWFFQELSGMFLVIGLVAGLIGRLNGEAISQATLEGIKLTSGGAFMVGFAASITILLEDASIIDTLCFYASEGLKQVPSSMSSIIMALAQTGINYLIPSGSGQALATLPIMLPLGELVGVSNQITILAFQIGDGVSNLCNPTLGGLVAMLSICRVPFDRWLKFIFPLTLLLLGISFLFLIIASFINYT